MLFTKEHATHLRSFFGYHNEYCVKVHRKQGDRNAKRGQRVQLCSETVQMHSNLAQTVSRTDHELRKRAGTAT
jgi:hypothetical protein